MTTRESRSHVSRWFMIVSLLTMVVMLTFVGLQTRKSLLKGTPATPAATAPAPSATSDGTSTGNQPQPEAGAVGNN
jgi:hypothetical protein